VGQVGAIFSLEASRLARSNQDWHRLLELCAITDTLVIDEDGCYNLAEFNDGPRAWHEGTLAQAERHIIRARLHAGENWNSRAARRCVTRCRHRRCVAPMSTAVASIAATAMARGAL
jgi:hypothetical protein